jgi:hypothetical protein
MPNKKNKRGSGNKSKQFDAAIAKDIQEGGLSRLKDFYTPPGFQGPIERGKEFERREQYIKEMKKRNQR